MQSPTQYTDVGKFLDCFEDLSSLWYQAQDRRRGHKDLDRQVLDWFIDALEEPYLSAVCTSQPECVEAAINLCQSYARLMARRQGRDMTASNEGEPDSDEDKEAKYLPRIQPLMNQEGNSKMEDLTTQLQALTLMVQGAMAKNPNHCHNCSQPGHHS